ncbi:MAG: polyprenyl synthetase family protein [Chloroflexi bacterium]|nr:polyprenyl synthetase family protein [Chloroflexota bacterium]
MHGPRLSTPAAFSAAWVMLVVHKGAAGIVHSLERDLAKVEQRLAEASAVEPPFLRQILEDVLLARGKQIRPTLTIASGKLFREATAPLYAMAAAVEFIHTATLIHDDVVDQADARRGEPALFTLAGNSVAVLVGDYLFAQAAMTASETNNVRIMHLFADAVRTLCAGQIAESAREGEARYQIDRETYYRTIEAKTATLFVFACHAGAILGEASAAETEALRRYGRSLGLAFQIVDDILDLVGDESHLGKPLGSDLRQGVVTLPVIYLREEVPEALLREAFTSDGSREEAIGSITEMARTSRAISQAYLEAQRCAADAARALEGVPHGEIRDLLLDLTASVVDRDR